MIVTHRQIAAFTLGAEKSFTRFAVNHMRERLLSGGEQELLVTDAARQAIAKGRAHGLTQEGPLLLFLDLTIYFGSGFDNDPQYKWAQPYLRDIPGLNSMERARLLYWHAVSYLSRVHGETNEWARSALDRFCTLDADRIRCTGLDLSSRIVDLLGWLHPQRMGFLTAPAINAICTKAQAMDFGSPEGTALGALIMFGLGHDAFEDPLHKWLSNRIGSFGNCGLTTDFEALLSATKSYAQLVLKRTEERKTDGMVP